MDQICKLLAVLLNRRLLAEFQPLFSRCSLILPSALPTEMSRKLSLYVNLFQPLSLRDRPASWGARFREATPTIAAGVCDQRISNSLYRD
jgi:hypothetical protein